MSAALPVTLHTLAALGFDQARPLWLWLLLALVAVGLPAWAYHLIHQRTGRPLALGLLVLRIVGVVALLAALAKPVWTRTQLDTQRPALAIVLDDSQSMNTPDSGGAGDGRSRYRLATDWLRQSPQAQLLQQRFDLKLYDMAGNPRELSDLPAEPAGEQTDLLRPLRQAGAALQGRHAAGVLLISDGRDTTGRATGLALEDFPLPVYAAGFAAPPASAQRAPDAAIVGLEAPQQVIVHNQVVIRLGLSWDGRRDAAATLQLEHAGAPLVTESITLGAGQRNVAASLTWTPREAGDFTLTARVLPAGGDRQEANNARTFRLRVQRDPLRIMLVEGVLRHEATYLIETLKSDPDLDVITLQRSANPHRAGGSAMLGGELFSPERLQKLNVILLGDFEARMLDERSYEAIAKWVEGGGGLMVLGGYQNLGPAGLAATPLARLLPLEVSAGASGVMQVDEPFAFTLTEEGKRHPALSISGDMVQDSAAWAALPALRGVVAPGAVRPGAQVLAQHPRGPAVLATQRFGKGAVAVLTADTTWRWSRLARLAGKPDTLYARFWLQMVRWLAQVEVRSDRPPIQVTSSAPTYARGQRVDLAVQRLATTTGAEPADAVVTLQVRWPDGRVTPLPLTPSALPNQWTASLSPSRGGRFEASASLRASPDAEPIASHSAEFLVEGSNLELEDPTPSPAALGQVARVTGGRFAELADEKAMAEMIEEIPADPRVVERMERAALWNHPLLFLVFLGCITAEWVMRRRNRLV